MEKLSAAEFNAGFYAAVVNGEVEKVAADQTNNIRLLLREKESIARTILQASPVTRAELNEDKNDRLFQVYDLVGEKRTAVVVPWTDEPPTLYIDVPKVEVDVKEIDTEEYWKNVDEIKMLHHSFETELEEQAKYGIQYKEDSLFMEAVNVALAATGQDLAIPAAPGQTYFYKEDFVKLLNILPSNADRPLRADTILMNEITWNNIQNWNMTTFGSDLVGEITINGVKFNTLLGVKVLTTIKSDIVPNNYAYAFAPIEYLGTMRIYEDITLWMEKRRKNIYWSYGEKIIMGILNAYAVSAIHLV